MPVYPFKETMPEIAEDVFIAPGACVIGDIRIGRQVSIWFNTVLRGDVNDITIGEGTNIQDGCVIHVSSTGQGTYIGADVTIGHMALLHACTIGDRAFIGMKACVMDDAQIEDGAMVAAGALVTPGKIVPSGQLWGGQPARYMRDMTVDETAFLEISARKYRDLASWYLGDPGFKG